MNIHRLYPGSSRATSGPTTEATDGERTRPTSPVSPTAPAGAKADSVELSDAARARQAKATAHKAEVETARQALRAQPGLSDERAAEIQQRMASGFYDRPDVLAQTAARLADDLGDGA